MKDGVYDFWFVALGRTHHGSLRLRGNVAEGGDGVHTIGGQLSRTGSNLLAAFDITVQTVDATGTTASIPGTTRTQPYSLKMQGTGTETEFSLLGLAPLGLIVTLNGRWKGTLDAG